MKRLLIVLLILCFVLPVIAVSPYINDPITEDTFQYKEDSKSKIEKPVLITIDITPFLSSGAKLNRNIHEKELPYNQMVTNLVEHVNNGVKKIKIVQIYPEALFEMSDDAETVKQSSTNGGKMKHEIYYGYQKSISQPWEKYYKVENCDATMCKVVRADFTTRVVTVTNVPLTEINKITGIVAYEALP